MRQSATHAFDKEKVSRHNTHGASRMLNRPEANTNTNANAKAVRMYSCFGWFLREDHTNANVNANANASTNVHTNANARMQTSC